MTQTIIPTLLATEGGEEVLQAVLDVGEQLLDEHPTSEIGMQWRERLAALLWLLGYCPQPPDPEVWDWVAGEGLAIRSAPNYEELDA